MATDTGEEVLHCTRMFRPAAPTVHSPGSRLMMFAPPLAAKFIAGNTADPRLSNSEQEHAAEAEMVMLFSDSVLLAVPVTQSNVVAERLALLALPLRVL